jgi:hypothetical protein
VGHLVTKIERLSRLRVTFHTPQPLRPSPSRPPAPNHTPPTVTPFKYPIHDQELNQATRPALFLAINSMQPTRRLAAPVWELCAPVHRPPPARWFARGSVCPSRWFDPCDSHLSGRAAHPVPAAAGGALKLPAVQGGGCGAVRSAKSAKCVPNPAIQHFKESDRLKMEDSEDRLPQTIHQFGSQRPTEVTRGAYESPECPLQLNGS